MERNHHTAHITAVSSVYSHLRKSTSMSKTAYGQIDQRAEVAVEWWRFSKSLSTGLSQNYMARESRERVQAFQEDLERGKVYFVQPGIIARRSGGHLVMATPVYKIITRFTYSKLPLPCRGHKDSQDKYTVTTVTFHLLPLTCCENLFRPKVQLAMLRYKHVKDSFVLKTRDHSLNTRGPWNGKPEWRSPGIKSYLKSLRNWTSYQSTLGRCPPFEVRPRPIYKFVTNKVPRQNSARMVHPGLLLGKFTIFFPQRKEK